MTARGQPVAPLEGGRAPTPRADLRVSYGPDGEPGWRNGSRDGLKIRWGQPRAGSIPPPVGRPSEVMEQPARHLGCIAGLLPRPAEVFDGLPVAMKDPRDDLLGCLLEGSGPLPLDRELRGRYSPTVYRSARWPAPSRHTPQPSGERSRRVRLSRSVSSARAAHPQPPAHASIAAAPAPPPKPPPARVTPKRIYGGHPEHVFEEPPTPGSAGLADASTGRTPKRFRSDSAQHHPFDYTHLGSGV